MWEWPPSSLSGEVVISEQLSAVKTVFLYRTDLFFIPEACLSSGDVTKLTGSFRLIAAVVDGAAAASGFLCFYPYYYYYHYYYIF